MLFNSFPFFLFLLILFLLIRILDSRFKNLLLLFGSYFFYAYWDWRFACLMGLVTVSSFGSCLLIESLTNVGSRRRVLLGIVALNFAFVGVFKYLDFFIDSFRETLSTLDMALQIDNVGLVLPIGISFYVFQATGYCVDVYKRQIEATRSFVNFALFISCSQSGLVLNKLFARLQGLKDLFAIARENRFDHCAGAGKPKLELSPAGWKCDKILKMLFDQNKTAGRTVRRRGPFSRPRYVYQFGVNCVGG